MKKHYVQFMSPGTMFTETSTKEIDSWDIDKAIEMAKHIVERHGAKPFGFAFLTKERKDDEMDSKEVDRSGVYYLGGTVKTYDEVVAESDPDKDQILLHNMKYNNIDKIVVNTNSYKAALPFNKNDVLLEVEL